LTKRWNFHREFYREAIVQKFRLTHDVGSSLGNCHAAARDSSSLKLVERNPGNRKMSYSLKTSHLTGAVYTMDFKRNNARFRGVKIDNVSLEDVVELVNDTLERNLMGYVCVSDVSNVIKATKDSLLRDAINSSMVSIADGTPLAWYAKLVGCRDIERISGMDLMVRLFEDKRGYKHFLLGDTEERINKVINKARQINGDIRISGYSPPFREFTDEDNRMMVEKITSEAPDIIWVSLGGGKQEKWMYSTSTIINRGVMIGVGAGFKWLIGELKTPPKIIQKMGLQWAYRIFPALLCNPIQNTKPVLKVLKWKLEFIRYFPGEVIRTRKSARE